MDIIEYAEQYIYFHGIDLCLLDYHKEALRGLVRSDSYIPLVMNFRYGKKIIKDIVEAYNKEFPITYKLDDFTLEFPKNFTSVVGEATHAMDALTFSLKNGALLRSTKIVSDVRGLTTDLVFTT